MKRAAGLLLACAAACSIYGSGDDDAPTTPPPAVVPTSDASDAATLDETDLTNDPVTGNEAGVTNDATPGPADAAPDKAAPDLPDLLVFLTSTTYPGKLSSVGSEKAGDDICNSLGVAHVGKKFVAWLSGPTGNAKDRVINKVIGRRYRRIDGALVIDKAEMMLDHSLDAAIVVDENGTLWGIETPVWTGTSYNGQLSASTCSGWFSSAPGTYGIGTITSPGGTWGTGNAAHCDETRHLYCFEVP